MHDHACSRERGSLAHAFLGHLDATALGPQDSEQHLGFRTDKGKALLDGYERAGDLIWTPWAPEGQRFSTCLGSKLLDCQRKSSRAPVVLRSYSCHGGLNDLRQADQVDVRQGIAMAKRAIRGLVEAGERGRFASLEHPFGLFLWRLPEAAPLYEGGWFWSTFSMCCFGGPCKRWTTIVHNSEILHKSLHYPPL